MQVSEAAWDLLAVMDEQAALANQKVDLFTSQERFPGVFEARANLAAAEKALVWLPKHRLSMKPSVGYPVLAVHEAQYVRHIKEALGHL